MRVLAFAIGLMAFAASTADGARESSCPHDASLGTVRFARGGREYLLSLATCATRAAGKPAAAPTAAVRGVVVRGHALWARRDGRPVRLTPELHGPDGLRSWPEPVSLSPDGRYVLWIRAVNSGSLTSDGLPLEITPLGGGRTRPLGVALTSADYRSWCGSALVLTAGGNRMATTNKRLVVARPPDWVPRPLWRAPGRAFGSVACARDGRSVAVLSQPASANGSFFSTRWQLWQVGLDGSRRLLDQPPPGFADESPHWSPDGRALLFVRERNGDGSLFVRDDGRLFGPLASLGYSLGFYGHHDWPVAWGP